MYIHTYIQSNLTYIHTCMHAWMHAYIHTCIHPYIHAYIHTHVHTYMHTYIHMHTYMHPQPCNAWQHRRLWWFYWLILEGNKAYWTGAWFEVAIYDVIDAYSHWHNFAQYYDSEKVTASHNVLCTLACATVTLCETHKTESHTQSQSAQAHALEDSVGYSRLASANSTLIFHWAVGQWLLVSTCVHVCDCAAVPGATTGGFNQFGIWTWGSWHSELQSRRREREYCTMPLD